MKVTAITIVISMILMVPKRLRKEAERVRNRRTGGDLPKIL